MNFLRPSDFDISKLNIAIDPKRKNPSIGYGEMQKAVAFVTPEATTKYPRVTGDGNFHEGNPYCPASIDKASYTLDLQDFKPEAESFLAAVDDIDEKLLKFFTENQKTLLNRQNLSEQEVKMLQHRNVKHKDDGRALSLSCRKFYTDSVGNRRERKPLICDTTGAVIPQGNVMPGDRVRATMTSGGIWIVNGKFGLHWEFGDISLISRPEEEVQSHVSAFQLASGVCYEPITSNA